MLSSLLNLLSGCWGIKEEVGSSKYEWHITGALGKIHGCLLQLHMHRKLSAEHGCSVVVQELEAGIRRWGKIPA